HLPISSLLLPSPLAPSAASPPFFFFQPSGAHRALHSFPTRRSSDLCTPGWQRINDFIDELPDDVDVRAGLIRDRLFPNHHRGDIDRKSTRLNSSHVKISYAVFCLKKKTNTQKQQQQKHIENSNQSRV